MHRRRTAIYNIAPGSANPKVEERDHRGKVVPQKRKKGGIQQQAGPSHNVAPAAPAFIPVDIVHETTPPERLHYPGDVTADEVIAHLQAIEDPVYRSKVGCIPICDDIALMNV